VAAEREPRVLAGVGYISIKWDARVAPSLELERDRIIGVGELRKLRGGLRKLM
jgi:hypothetical protein